MFGGGRGIYCLVFSFGLQGVSKKCSNVCLFDISGTNERISTPFFSSENLDPYVNFEYKINFVRLQGAEIFAKQNRFPV